MRHRCVLWSLTAAAAMTAPVLAFAQWPAATQPGMVQWPDPPTKQGQSPAAPKSKAPARAQAPADVEELTPAQIQRAQDREPVPGAAGKAPAAAAKPKAKAGSVVRVVACSGAFARNSSHVRLAQFFGQKNVAFTEVDGPENSKLMASVLYPGDPRQRLEVLWENETARSDTQLIVISGNSAWNGPRGLKLGADLTTIERANGKPFKLGAFDGDGATVLDWQGGAFASVPGGCKINLRLIMDSRTPDPVRGQVTTGKEFASNEASVRAAKPSIAEIWVGY